MMESRNNPKVLRIGSGYLHKLAEILTENSVEGKLMYVSGPVVDKLYGSIVRPQLETVGRVRNLSVDSNSIAYAMTLAEEVIATDVDCIVGMGGGKVLDVCKYAAFIAKVPLLNIPTTTANDGIASPIAVLKRRNGKPKSLGCAVPDMVLIDTDVIMSGPEQLIRAGIGDTISNYMALQDWDFAVKRGRDNMNGYAYLMSQTSLEAMLKSQYSSICPEFVSTLANSLVISGVAMDFAGSSRPVSGSEHLFSHALDYYGEQQNLHGFQVALGTVAVLKLINHDASEVIEYLARFGVDINPIHMGISEDLFVLCLQKGTSMRKHRYTYLHEVDLSEFRLRNLYKELVRML